MLVIKKKTLKRKETFYGFNTTHCSYCLNVTELAKNKDLKFTEGKILKRFSLPEVLGWVSKIF